jgi:hypothetical protein
LGSSDGEFWSHGSTWAYDSDNVVIVTLSSPDRNYTTKCIVESRRSYKTNKEIYSIFNERINNTCLIGSSSNIVSNRRIRLDKTQPYRSKFNRLLSSLYRFIILMLPFSIYVLIAMYTFPKISFVNSSIDVSLLIIVGLRRIEEKASRFSAGRMSTTEEPKRLYSEYGVDFNNDEPIQIKFYKYNSNMDLTDKEYLSDCGEYILETHTI